MDAFVAEELIAGLEPDGHDFAEFFRSPTLSLTVARWPAGSVDDQEPHTEDEVYYVVSGRARLSVADEDAAVGAGSIAYVTAGVEHRFHDIEEDLSVIVFWAPPRHSNAPQPMMRLHDNLFSGNERVRTEPGHVPITQG